jgi:hypothetical protein
VCARACVLGCACVCEFARVFNVYQRIVSALSPSLLSSPPSPSSNLPAGVYPGPAPPARREAAQGPRRDRRERRQPRPCPCRRRRMRTGAVTDAPSESAVPSLGRYHAPVHVPGSVGPLETGDAPAPGADQQAWTRELINASPWSSWAHKGSLSCIPRVRLGTPAAAYSGMRRPCARRPAAAHSADTPARGAPPLTGRGFRCRQR